MGSGGSKQTPNSSDPTIPVMPTLAPYNGRKVQYFFLGFNASITTQETEIMTVQATDTDQFFPSLADVYKKGYRLSLNICQPVFTKLNISENEYKCVLSRSVSAKYMAIFRAAFPEEHSHPVELHMINATIKHKTLDARQPVFEYNDTCLTTGVSDCQDIFKIIREITSKGGRVVCLEYPGMGRQRVNVYREMYAPPEYSGPFEYNPSVPELHLPVNIYYETPVNPSNEKFKYEFVNCPMVVVGSSGWARNNRKLTLDWESAIKPYMDTGWKLVDIYEDLTATVSGYSGSKMSKSLLWVFEKPASRLHVTNPVYEVTMAVQWFEVHKNATSRNNVATEFAHKTDVVPLLRHMGAGGWEVVRFLETTEQRFKTVRMRTSFTKHMVFFQRRIVLCEGEAVKANDLS